MGGIRDRFDDWMVRVSFAEASQPEMGMALTGGKEDWKAKLAFDKIMVVRSEKMAKQGITEEPVMAEHSECESAHAPGDKLRVMILDDEPIVGKRLKPALAKFGFEVEVTVKVAKKKYRIYEVPISYYGRTYAEGKKITWKDGFAAFYFLVRFWLKG